MGDLSLINILIFNGYNEDIMGISCEYNGISQQI
jgi:hypothetical protein